MSETPQQTPEGIDRTPTGEIKDQSQPPTQTSTTKEAGSEKDQTQGSQETKPEDKSADGKSLLNQDGDKKEEVASGAPEKYEAFTAPEGFVITEDATKQVSELFKEMNLSQAQGQKLIDYIAPQLMEAVEAPYNQYQEMRQGWQKEVMDKYGSKLSEVKTTVSRALDSLGNPKAVAAFKEAMDLTGAGDNPAFIDIIYEFAKKVSEGTHVRAGGPSKLGQVANNRPASAAAAMYPHLPSAG